MRKIFFVYFLSNLLSFFHIFYATRNDSVLVCPVEERWLRFQKNLLCSHNGSSTIGINCSSDLYRQIAASMVVWLYEKYWPHLYERHIRNLSICGIKNIVLKLQSQQLLNFENYCTSYPTIFISMERKTFNFLQGTEHLTQCQIKPVYEKHYTVQQILKTCSNAIWLFGNDDDCNKSENISVLETQKLFHETQHRNGIFANKTLKIGVFSYRPFVIKNCEQEKRCYYDGMCVRMVATLQKAFGFKFEIIEHDGFGIFRNGSWTGLVGMLVRKEIDFAAMALTVTEARSKVVDFSVSYFFEEIGILIPKPQSKLTDDVWQMFTLFSYAVWIWILIATIVSMVTLYLLHKFAAIVLNCAFVRLTHSSWYIFTSMLAQPEEMSPKTWSIQNFLVCFWFYAFAIISIYSGGLIAMLTSSSISIPFTDRIGLQNAVKEGTYRVCLEANTAFYDLVSKDSQYEVIYDFLLKNPQFVANESYCIDQLQIHNDVAYLGEMTRLREIQLVNCNDTFKLILLDDTFYPEIIAFAMQKNSSMLPLFNSEILNAIDGGLFEEWKSNFSVHHNFCTLAKPFEIINYDNDPLSIFELGGPFILLCFGLFVSVIVFLFEHYKRQGKNEQLFRLQQKRLSADHIRTISVQQKPSLSYEDI